MLVSWANLALSVVLSNDGVLDGIARLLDAVPLVLIRAVVLWASLALSCLGDDGVSWARWLLADSSIDRLGIVRAFFTPCVLAVLRSAALNLDLVVLTVDREAVVH